MLPICASVFSLLDNFEIELEIADKILATSSERTWSRAKLNKYRLKDNIISYRLIER
jgi:hypothetical protein